MSFVTQFWQVEDGLPGNNVSSIVQTPDGYLWVGTPSGLARFDGVRFEIFDSSTPGLEDGQVQRLFVDAEGALWVALTSGQLVRHADGAFVFFHGASGRSMKPPVTFARNGSDGFLVQDSDGVLHRFEKESFRQVGERANASARSSPFLSRTMDGSGTEWALNADRLIYRFSGDEWAPVMENGLEGIKAEFIAGNERAGLWVFEGERIRLLEREKWTMTLERPRELDVGSVTRVISDSKGNVWIATARAQLFRFSLGAPMVEFSTRTGFPAGPINDLCEDREGNIWVASMGGGLIRLRRSVFETFGLAHGLPPEPVHSIAEISSGKLLLSTAFAGTFVMENGRFFGPLALPGMPSSLRVLHGARGGGIWAGTDGDGILKLYGKDSARWPLEEELREGTVQTIYEDRAGMVWVGTESGLSRFEGRKFVGFSNTDGLLPGSVHAITQDSSGEVWIGTSNGLSRFGNGRFHSYQRKDGLPADQIRTLLADRNGALWIGTFGGGLSRLRDGKFAHFSTRHGLPDNSITVLLDDGAGYLWLGTPRGICRVARSALDAVAEGRATTLDCSIYTPSDGLASIQCGSGSSSAIKTSDGKLWFATARGVSVVDPQRLETNRLPPPVRIEEVSVDGDVLFSNRRLGRNAVLSPVSSGHMSLQSGRRHVEIAYTALSLSSPGQTRFRLILEGLDKAWRDVGDRRVAYYDGLPAGNYRFRVKACNNDGVWSSADAAFAFTVVPSLWETRWFQWSGMMGLVGVGFVLFRRRVLQKERERTAEALRLQSAALACAGNGIVITDRHANIVWTNPAFTRMTGYGAGEVIGRNARILKSGRHPAEFYGSMWKTILAGEIWHGEIINRNKDGTLATYEQTTTPVRDPNGKITHFVAIKRDITETRRAQRQIQLLEQHQALESERSRIARDMHDEMGTSLTKITLLSEAAEIQMASHDAGELDRARQRLQKIAALGRSLVTSMDEIVWAVNPGNDTVEAFVTYICHFAPDLLKLADLHLRIDVPSVLPRRPLHSEVRHHLFLVIKEALNNVIKHARATHVTLKMEVQSDALTILIADDGCGIGVNESRRTGNGLANMRARLERVGGKMEFTSRPDQGTRIQFIVFLPAESLS
ncbi:MAG: two-component regulator propeller domain-containing protein [Verrucomicrobiota bacterium]